MRRREISGMWHMLCAAARGNDAAFDKLLRAGAEVQALSRSGDTLLMLAARGNHAVIVRRLVALRVGLDAQNTFGDTALILASQAGAGDVVALLLQAGAKKSLRNRDGVAALTEPPCNSAIRLTIDSPSPLPVAVASAAR